MNSIGYEFEGETYELPVCVELPEIGFYTEPEASEENYIGDLAVGGEGVVCYVIAINDITLTEVHLMDEFIDVAAIEEYGENCWKITFTGEVENDHWYRIWCDGFHGDGWEFYEREESIHVMNTAPRLVIRQIEENEEGFFEHPDWDMHTEWAPAINHHVSVKFYFFDGENYIPVDPDALGCSGSVELHSIEGTEFVRIVPTGWGDSAICYEHEDGKTYELPVHVVLPTFGFYTTPYASEESYIWELEMNGESAEIYFIAINDAELYSVELINGFEEIAHAEYVNGYCWKITVDGSYQDGRYYDIYYTGFEPWCGEFERQDGLHIFMDENMPRLMIRDIPMDENGNWYEDESWDMYRDWYGPIGNHINLRVYFFDGENYIPVDPDALYSDGTITVNRIGDTDFVELIPNEWGDHTVSYEYDGVTYSLTLHVQLSDFGFYSSEEASEETYLTEFRFNDENRVFYFVAAHDATLSRVTLNGDHDAIADIEYISDTCYRITITDAFENGYWLDVSFDGTESNGNPVENWGQGIRLEDTTPGLRFRYAAWDEEGQFWFDDPNEPAQRVMNAQINHPSIIAFHFFDGENEYFVDLDELVFPDILNVNREGERGCVFAEPVGFGEGVVTYVRDGETYELPVYVSLPTFGFYTTDYPDEASYITEFTVSEENNVFYLVSNYGATLDDVTLLDAFGEVAYVEQISNTCWQITVTGEIDDGFHYTLAHYGYESWGDEYEYERSIRLLNWNPDTEDAELLAQAEAAGLLTYLEVSDLNAELTRLDTVKLMAAMLNIAPIPDAELSFTDCDELTQEEKELLAAVVEAGIINGTAEGTFMPYALLTHAQLATMIHRALGEPETENSANAPETVWYLKAVLALQDLGIITEDDILSIAGDIMQVRGALQWMIRAKEVLDSGDAIRRGDLNGDGDVTARDVIILLEGIAAMSTGEWPEELYAAADVSNDGRISARDAIIILDAIAAQATDEL